MQNPNGNSNGDRAPLGWDLRSVVFVAITVMWMISVTSDIVLKDWEMPSYIHLAMLGVLGYFVGDRVKKR